MREVEVRIDPYTKEKFFPKRSNQIFATPQNKMKFHNERAKEYRGAIGVERIFPRLNSFFEFDAHFAIHQVPILLTLPM